jgi:uncharacterized membrane protein
MEYYALIKTLHIMSSVLLVGTGFGSAFYLFFANRSDDIRAQAVVARLVVRADWWFTTPTVIIQPATGFLMIYLAGIPLSSFWVMWGMAMYLVAGLCWLPVVWLQIQMEKMLRIAVAENQDVPERYWRFAKYWERLGYPAFIAMVWVFYLMTAKPNSF